MAHRTHPDFWRHYDQLPQDVQDLADKSFELLKQNPNHPSLRFKKVGDYWSARVGRSHRAIAIEIDVGLLWTWIGPDDEYERMIGR